MKGGQEFCIVETQNHW